MVNSNVFFSMVVHCHDAFHCFFQHVTSKNTKVWMSSDDDESLELWDMVLAGVNVAQKICGLIS
jgi:hypothetical protein